MDLELTGRTAIVTGGTRGIGKAIAFELAREGVDVAVVGRDQDMLTSTAGEISAATGRRVVPLVCDVGERDQVDAMVSEAVGKLGGVNILVNSAAEPGGGRVPLAEVDDDAFWMDVNVKVVGALRCIRAVAPHMAHGGGGRIVNISGLGARMTGSTVGTIRNVGLAAMSKTLADELAPDGIRVMVVHPGMTRTERMPERLATRAAAAGVPVEEMERRMGAGNLLGRIVSAEEIAYVVAFLVSPKAIAINGDAIAAGGGSPGSIHY